MMLNYNVSNQSLPANAITFFKKNDESNTEVMRITKEGIYVNPDVSVNDAAKAVLNALSLYLNDVLENARKDEREECAKVCEKYAQSERFDEDYIKGFADGADTCANSIRERGKNNEL
jgi:hypothetical protein